MPKDPIAAQIAEGQPIYRKDCATEACHGLNGEGLPSTYGGGYRVWPLLGDEFASRNPNAQVIFDVTRSGGEQQLRKLSDAQIYAAIAYELSLNGIGLIEPLDDTNANAIPSGKTNPKAPWGSLYPPPGNARLIETPLPYPSTPPSGSNSKMAIRIGQLARAHVIGRSVAPQGGYFIILVFYIQNLGTGDLTVDPVHLALVDSLGKSHRRTEANLAYPMVRFRPQAIQPGYGTSGYEIFTIPPGAEHDRFVYRHPSAGNLEIKLYE